MTDDLIGLLVETREIAARTEAKVDSLALLVAQEQGVRQDHEERLRAVERWRWGIPGGLLAALAALFIPN